jgi:hypothetical protein
LIVNFLNHLETVRGNGAGSRTIRLAAIISFMRYMKYRVLSTLQQIQRILAIPSKKVDTRLVLPIPHKKAGTNHLIHHPLRRNFGAQTPQS